MVHRKSFRQIDSQILHCLWVGTYNSRELRGQRGNTTEYLLLLHERTYFYYYSAS